ncbi:phosphoinositide phospholipase C 2 isoform X3 [Cryptomeria japonica]|uniref:phosphoinositide phospholipase C 2 isoform X3 n=1 Tax=Cryptomeria japonica TaxID=3369 RepID=UPI0027D9E3E0|nr:phosphoinositide phospholipase C 2 isoform X3 [Cryptomeria japonica]
MDTYKVCGCFRRKFRAGSAEPPGEIKDLFQNFSENGVMSVTHLQKFLGEVQGEAEASELDAQMTIDAQKPIDVHRLRSFFTVTVSQRGLDLDAFLRYLFNDDRNLPVRSNEVHHDMTAPLSHYFIYTGHNSYLTGNQLSSDCSDAPIIKALKKGVRVIELDIWPNSSKDNILVLHGRTLTTPVDFKKCLDSIKMHAFDASPYPVIITLEDHLTKDLQAKAAELIIETFGELLYYPKDSEDLEEFPTPESLKRRIIISTKPPKEYSDSKTAEIKANGDKLKQKTPDEEPWGDEIPDYRGNVPSEGKGPNGLEPVAEDSDDDEETLQRNPDKDAAPEYKRLITIRAGKPKGGSLKDAIKVDEKQVRRVSLSEPQLEKAASSHSSHLVRFTQKNILRVYPKGTRVDSSNYNPLIAWFHGAQMVALNMQIKIYMGDGWTQDFKKTHFDTYSPPDFYTRVGIAGVPADTVMKKTQTIEDNWTPHWNEEFEFPLTVPELALLRVEVHEYDMSEKDDFGGQTCLPVAELKKGIRTLPLYDKKGEKYKAVKLLVRIEFVSV